MIVYVSKNKRLVRQLWQAGEMIPENAVWIDMNSPTQLQERTVEDFLGIDIPTREEMNAIEVSDRLYQENGAYFLTATLLTKMDGPEAEQHAVTFVVANNVLVTVRYSDPVPFTIFATQLDKIPAEDHNGPALLLGLLDSITNRVADVLERLGHDLDAITKRVFNKDHECAVPVKYETILSQIGHSGDLSSKVRESLMTLARLVAFATQCNKLATGDNLLRLQAQKMDINGLSDHVSYLSSRVNFLLDATLGMISIEQNGAVKVLSIASLVFMPPTLVAGIYGMNFHLMPELSWHWGYPMAMVIILVSSILPYAYLKQRKWI
jgi:magnesium transporter